MSTLSKDLFPKITGPRQSVIGLHSWTSQKVQKKGLNIFLLKVWRYHLKSQGYQYYYGVAANPITMHMERKYAQIVKEKVIHLPSFEMPDGSKPFKHFNYGNHETVIMAYLANLEDAKL